MIEWKLIDNLSRHLDLSQVGAGTHLAIVADVSTDPALVDALGLAAQRSRTSWASITWSGSGDPAEHAVVTAALSTADALVNLASSPATRSAISRLCAEHETTVLDVRGAVEDFAWFSTHSGIDDRLGTAERLLQGVEWLELSTTADNVLDVSCSGISAEANSSIVSGLSTHVVWPAGTLCLVPGPATVNGEVTVMPGDINQAAGDWFQAPVVLVIDDNQIADVLGNSGDADRLLAQLEAIPTTSRHALTGIQIGMHRDAPNTGQLFTPRLLDEPVANLSGGHVTLGFGEGPRHQVGGLESALRLTLRSASLRADDQLLVTNGILSADLAPDIYEQATW